MFRKLFFLFCVSCSTSVMAADSFLCQNVGVFFNPQKSPAEYCETWLPDDHDECLNIFYREKAMYEKGKCLPITVKEYVRQSPKYQNNTCAIKVSTVQVEGTEYMVRYDAPCLTNFKMGAFDEKFELMDEEEAEITRAYSFLPNNLYPEYKND